MGKAPADQFYYADFLRDTNELSLAATGGWMKCLCKMWFSVTRGQISMPLSGYARMFGCTVDQAQAVLEEIRQYRIGDAVTEANGNITLVNRRMFREAKEAEANRNRQTRYREKHKESDSNANVTPPSSSSSSSSSSEEKKREGNAASPPAPGQPTAADFGDPKNTPAPASLFNHPAIVALRTITKHNPPKEAWPLLSERLGVDVDIGRLTKAVAEWRAAGNRATNFTGIVDWYLGERKHGTRQAETRPEPIDEWAFKKGLEAHYKEIHGEADRGR